MKSTIIKKIFLTIISFLTIIFFTYFLWRFAYKSKASEVKVKLDFVDNNISFKQNEEKSISFTLTTENPNNYKISAVDLSFKFDSDNKDLIDFVSFSAKRDVNVSTGEYFDEVLKKTVERKNGAKILRIVAVAKKDDNQLSGVIFFNLKFKAKQIQGTNTLSFVDGINQVVGITGSSDNLFKLQLGLKSVVSYNVNNEAIAPAGNVTLNLKLKFQGIAKKPQDQYNKLKVKVTAVSPSGEKKVSVGEFVAHDIDNDHKGIWIGSVSLNLTPGTGYKILVKGEKHIQKKICHQKPSESRLGPGTYSCDQGKINLQAGNNDLDFSEILLLSGDLPVGGEQDGVVNSADTSFVRNNLGKSDPQTIAIGDINLDGVVNAQDWSLIIAALSVRGDEE